MTQPNDNRRPAPFEKRIAIMRIAFGIVWAIDAAFKFEPAFYRGILEFIKAKDAGEPSWLNPWFHAWYHIVGVSPHFFAILIIIIETSLALSLILGVGRRIGYLAGAVFSFLLWSVGEAFGGPYVAGSTDLNAGIIYVLMYSLLYVTDYSKQPYWSIEPWLIKRFKGSRRGFSVTKKASVKAKA